MANRRETASKAGMVVVFIARKTWRMEGSKRYIIEQKETKAMKKTLLFLDRMIDSFIMAAKRRKRHKMARPLPCFLCVFVLF